MARKICKLKFNGRYLADGAIEEGEEYEEIFENEKGEVKMIARHTPIFCLNGIGFHIKEVYNVVEE